MAQMIVNARKCTGCGLCLESCAFGAIVMAGDKADITQACRACGACLKACPHDAIIRLEAKADIVDKSRWNGIMVIAEQRGDKLHPVSRELVGKALDLAQGTGQPVRAVVFGERVGGCASELLRYGISETIVYESPQLSFFRADAFASCAEDAIRLRKPAVVLIGATALGRSLAPRISTRFRTGLTADCTGLELRPDGSLVQMRPAFGGNIMARIVTPCTRPQFATVRYKVMAAPACMVMPSGVVTRRKLPAAAAASAIRHVSTAPVPAAASISDAEILVAGGRGLSKPSDLDMVRTLASLLGGEWATSRPLAEKGWVPNTHQIGLSGRTVRPKLLITAGISGAIQFTACMNAAERIVAINTDPEAPIFRIAHVAVVGDLYEVLPELIGLLRKEKRDGTV